MIGRLIGGRYLLQAPLGEGGMATLWRALDQQLGREVAVKLLRPQYSADPGFAARFRQEARAAASLSHQNIVSVYDYGTDPDGETQFIVMQLVEGRDLSAILHDRGRLEADDAVRVGISVASALEAAHRRGIVHRDVKPGNILITDEGEVKVTDFGIARAVSEASMTVTGTTLGSVHYFSPEQARGDEVTGTSDVYALGIVLYEMLTGRRPFEGDSAAGVALKRLTDDPPRPTVDGHPLPSGLEAILRRALERDPARRFPDAGSFAEALRAWRRQPDEVPAVAVAGVPEPAPASTPPAGEPTMYVPPPVARPSDRVPYARTPAQARPADEGSPWWIWILAILAVVLLGAIGFLGAQLFGGLSPAQGSPTPSVQTFPLPNWVGKSITAAKAEGDRLGLTVNEQREASSTVPNNEVISTEPPAGTQVKRGDPITVHVSSGQETVKVPSVIGQTRAEAKSTLETNHLTLGNVRQEANAAEAGTVIRTNPAAGVDWPRGGQVDLVLSLGPTPSPTPSPTPVPTPPPTPTPVPSPSS